jgi:hypothetical protein
MNRALAPLALASVALVSLACAEEPEPREPRRVANGYVTEVSPGTRADRCAEAVRQVASGQLDCAPESLELHAVGVSTVLTSGCGRSGTFLCTDPAPDGAVSVSRER